MNENFEHITTMDEAAKIMHNTNTNSYRQLNRNNETIVAYEADDMGFLQDVTDREKAKEEIEKQKKILKSLQLAAARAAKQGEKNED